MAVERHVRGRKSSGEGLMVCMCVIEGEKIFLEGSEKSVGCSGDKRWREGRGEEGRESEREV